MNSLVAKVSWLLAAHYLGDLILQPDWMAKQKGSSYSVLSWHAAVYGASFLAVGFGWTLAVALAVPHFFIDAAKSRWKLHNSLLLDQLLHLSLIAAIAHRATRMR